VIRDRRLAIDCGLKRMVIEQAALAEEVRPCSRQLSSPVNPQITIRKSQMKSQIKDH
jgi:hypothetical protein